MSDNFKKLKILIENGTFLDKEEKEYFLNLLKNISENKILKLIIIFENWEKEIENIHIKYKKEKQIFFKKYIDSIDKNIISAKKELKEIFEKKSLKEDEKTEEILLQKIDKI